ncbi:transporter substrate-binding domain-containing protein [Mesorhizobium sp. M7A.F.Ca.US.011.01.1.1]|uniref:transporter substrate-binding domain-containing protein n=1 Tax=Mesorhizobium sp. M7A.F.Ca.US.011.01.1.1 TaxID=2496741 RepID=UPI000FCCD33E|nr:transporter substrate-binding domain-containing protein [Mesorhizobium sp. M7A.F.Ca.US.011.01.1.1]RUX22074.1 transporter substrate-binding domain-containing protein [Mesorhizobium sp. M7A.F.Ca.US.011.01.1.1]
MKPTVSRSALGIFGAIALSMAVSVSGAHADALADIQAKGVFTVATETANAPFDFVKDGKIVGYTGDIIDIIMRDPVMKNVKLDRLDVPWSGILPGLAAGRFDFVVSALTVTEERAAKYHLTTPVADATVAIMKKASDDTITKPSDIAGKNVGSQTGSAQLAAAQAYAEELAKAGTPVASFKDYTAFDEAYADLAAGRVDVVINSMPNLLDAVRVRPEVFAMVDGTIGPKKYYSWAGRPGEDQEALNKFIDDKIAEMNKDGTLSKLQEKWFGVRMEVPSAPIRF